MNRETQIPKELTHELLSLVLDTKGYLIELIEVENNELKVCYCTNVFKEDNEDKLQHFKENINLDTLTRLMKEWCFKQDVILNTSFNLMDENMCSCSSNFYKIEGDLKNRLHWANTEFEAVLKATHWIMTEKGYIK